MGKATHAARVGVSRRCNFALRNRAHKTQEVRLHPSLLLLLIFDAVETERERKGNRMQLEIYSERQANGTLFVLHLP